MTFYIISRIKLDNALTVGRRRSALQGGGEGEG